MRINLVGLIVIALCIYTTIDCARNVQDTTKKFLWIALIWILPLAGIILYYLLGKKSQEV